MLPKEIGFQKLEIRLPEVVLITRTGEFSLDAMSGGINALFGIAWQIHTYGATADKCTVTVDEPENHLHPSMQRSILPSLAQAFPRYRFIVATHSPFIVSSFPEASVYGLVFNDEGQVASQQLELSDLAGTPNRVLREILDVPSNLPVWVEDRVAAILRDTQHPDPEQRARMIMAALREIGLADSIPEMPWEGEEGA